MIRARLLLSRLSPPFPSLPRKKKSVTTILRKLGGDQERLSFANILACALPDMKKKMNQYEINGYKANLFSLFSVADPLVLGRGRAVDSCDCPISF